MQHDVTVIYSAKVLIGHFSIFWQNYDIFRNSLYFRKRYLIQVMIEQIIIFIDQLIEFLPPDKYRYPHSVKAHQNVHATALKLRTSDEKYSFCSKNLVYKPQKVSDNNIKHFTWIDLQILMVTCSMNIFSSQLTR